MSNELIFYTHPMSRGRIARWMLEEVGEEYRVEVLQYEQMKSAAYRAVNPMGKVPALRHGDVVVTEAAAICAYLADAFPEAGLAPDTNARGAYYRWLFFAAGPLEAATTNRLLGFEIMAEQRQGVGYGDLDTVVDVLEQAVAGGGYVAGEAFSAADVYVAWQIGFGIHTLHTFPARPAFVDYHERMSTRPAHLRASARDDALAAEIGPPA